VLTTSWARIKGIVVFHFIFAYMPHLIASPQTSRPPEGDLCDVWMTSIVNIRASSASSFYPEQPSENFHLYGQRLI